jgi:hypothetical protein
MNTSRKKMLAVIAPTLYSLYSKWKAANARASAARAELNLEKAAYLRVRCVPLLDVGQVNLLQHHHMRMPIHLEVFSYRHKP